MTRQDKYSGYRFEDFLQDDFFVASFEAPTEESVEFWDCFLDYYPEKAAEYLAAQTFLEDVVESQISDIEVAMLWAKIQKRIDAARIFLAQRYTQRRKLAWTAAVAASIAVLLMLRAVFFDAGEGATESDIMAFVGSQVDTFYNTDEIQLHLSDQKTLLLHGAEIVYDSAGIHAGAQQVSRSDMAAFNQLIVPHGKNTVLTLHDGTRIWVNAGTRLVYPVEFNDERREIYVNGEIFLDVARDTHRPFIVRTNDLQIEVAGTRFNVQAHAADHQSRVALVSGAVKVSSGSDNVMLTPNRVYEKDVDGNTSVRAVDDIQRYTSWTQGLYMYQSEQLDVILKRLERYYGRQIVTGAAVSEIRCSGKLDLKENLEEVLAIISKTAPIEYNIEGDKFIVNYKP